MTSYKTHCGKNACKTRKPILQAMDMQPWPTVQSFTLKLGSVRRVFLSTFQAWRVSDTDAHRHHPIQCARGVILLQECWSFILRETAKKREREKKSLMWLYLNKWFLFPLAGSFRMRAIWKTTLEKQPSLFVQMQKHSRVALWSLEINITGGGVHTSESKIISTSNTTGRREARSTRKGKWNIVSKKYKWKKYGKEYGYL